MGVLLTPDQVRERLNLQTTTTVYRWIASGEIPSVALSKRAIRVREEDLDAFIRDRATGGRVDAVGG